MVQVADWLAAGYQGEMDYLQRHAEIRQNPRQLLNSAETSVLRALVVTMDYLPAATQPSWQHDHSRRLGQPDQAVVSVYAHGRDYHKVLRSRLARLAERLQGQANGHYQFRGACQALRAGLARQAHLALEPRAGQHVFSGRAAH